MHKRKYRFWQWIKSDGASIAGSGISNVVVALVGSFLGAMLSGLPGMFVGAIFGALLGTPLGHYIQKALSTIAGQQLRPYEVLSQSAQKSREQFYLKQKARQEESNVEEYTVVYLGYNADTGFYRFRRLDNDGVVSAQVKDFRGGIGIGDTLIFRRQRGSSYAIVERV